MIKVIKDGRIKQVTCSNCQSILEYADDDKTQKKYYPAEYGRYGIYYTYGGWKDMILCPICEKDVIVL